MVESFVIFIRFGAGDRTQFQIPARSQIIPLAVTLRDMKKYSILILLFVFLGNALDAQTIEILKRENIPTKSNDEDFSFIEPRTDMNLFTFVGTIRATGSDGLAKIEVLFFKLKETAHELGANCFKLNDFLQTDVPRQSILTLDVYQANDSTLNLNFENHEKNVVYVFGDERKTSDKYTFKIDNVKMEFKAGTYFRYENKVGQEVKINKGGFTGMTLWIKWKENKPSSFLTLTGLGLGGGQVPYGTVGVAFNTGRINRVDGNLGHLLTQVMEKSE